ncbi:hypothetical protein [Candidatus Odyssella acanthamoebae]|uniref:Uncharacterized protein n=1 Tax=Candidatus Odyssella acanthamoebae TaxID=91604 RepID=A0A077AUE4_9PROT|nr:hypothetical protein [Candidatus Paracaedibacter acanthamoebae]AIK95981.1 hypothetical protein ID47_03335 [Candidatus Paracaedibacter acanthamoebae]
MKVINKSSTFAAFLLLSTTLNAMEKDFSTNDSHGALVTTQEIEPLVSANGGDIRSTTSILTNGFAYGVLTEVVQSSCHNFENALHNLVAIHGIDGISLFFEKVGQKTGDIATKQLVNMAVQKSY